MLGALVELAIIRRFFRAPRLILTVVTIGLAQLLAAVTLFLPRWLAMATGREESEVAATAERVSIPWDISFVREPLIFSGDYVLAWIVAPVALISVALFLRYTSVGIAIRASAERSDRASLLGVPVKRLHTYVWAIAAVLSFVGLFLRAGIVGLPIGTAFSLTILLLALAALMLGGSPASPPSPPARSRVGVLEQGVAWNDDILLFRTIHPFGLEIDLPTIFTLAADRAVLVTPIIGLVIVVAAVRPEGGHDPRRTGRLVLVGGGGGCPAGPPGAARVPEVQIVRYAVVGVVVVALLLLPHLLGTSDSLKASAVAIYAIIALSIVVLTGWAGAGLPRPDGLRRHRRRGGCRGHQPVGPRPHPCAAGRRGRRWPGGHRRRPPRPPPARPVPRCGDAGLRVGHHRLLPQLAVLLVGAPREHTHRASAAVRPVGARLTHPHLLTCASPGWRSRSSSSTGSATVGRDACSSPSGRTSAARRPTA
ncbi:MAG: hypothetical protein U5R31_00320 [Acidimicrobiia bacterium]|nr:hypothetical protein [Acidimicrobiia bacterium]